MSRGVAQKPLLRKCLFHRHNWQVLILSQQVRQLRHVGRDARGFVSGERLRRRCRFPFEPEPKLSNAVRLCMGLSQGAPEKRPVLSKVEARQGVTGHNVRYVLLFGLAGVIVAFVAIYLFYFH
jgi:hypothetical protein